MSGDLADLYQEVIIDHGRRPRNFRELEGATRTAEGLNPLCGDQLTLYVKLADGTSPTSPSKAPDARSPKPRPR